MTHNKIILAGQDPDAKLDTGMSAKEAMERARIWWQKTGRRLMRETAEHQLSHNAGFASENPDDPNYLPSGVINGVEWDQLTKREMLTIIKHWHHFYVRVPDVIGTPEHEFNFKNRGDIK